MSLDINSALDEHEQIVHDLKLGEQQAFLDTGRSLARDLVSWIDAHNSGSFEATVEFLDSQYTVSVRRTE